MIIKKIDYRKKIKKREIFFGMPVAVFLLFILMVFSIYSYKPLFSGKAVSSAGSAEGGNLNLKFMISMSAIFAVVLIMSVIAKRAGKTAENSGIKDKSKAKKYDNLDNYIKKALESGFAKDEIRKRLLEKNWPEEIADDFLNKF